MKRLLICSLTFGCMLILSGCESTAARDLLGSAVGNAADTQVGYSHQQCFKVKSECVEGHYQEWQTSEGDPGCSCKKL